MPTEKAINSLSIMFVVQALFASLGMLTFAYAGYFYGIAMVLAVTILTGGYLLYLTYKCLEALAMEDQSYSYIGITNTAHNGHNIVLRAFTNTPDLFNKAVANSQKSRCLSKEKHLTVL